MGFQLVMRGVVIPVHGRFLQGAVHAFDLPIGRGMLRLGHPVFNAVPVAASAEHVAHITRCRTVAVPRRMAELATVIGQDDVDRVGDRCDQIVQEGCGNASLGCVVQLRVGELARAIDGDVSPQNDGTLKRE